MSGLGAMLKAGRKSAGLKQREMAESLGLHFTYVSKIENDATPIPPSDRVLEAWAERCGLDLDDVYHAAGKCPPDLEERLRADREFVRAVRELLPMPCPRCSGMGMYTDCPNCLNTGVNLVAVESGRYDRLVNAAYWATYEAEDHQRVGLNDGDLP